MSKDEIFLKIAEYKELYDFSEIVPISALKNKNIDTLIKVIKSHLTDNIKYFADNQVTNKSKEFIISELIREKIFNATDDEVPHSLTCIIEKIENKKDAFIINACVIVDRDSLKKIIIGHNGSKIKDIGIKARKDIEQFVGKKVFLDIYVKTIKKWRDKEKYLAEFGYNDFEL